MSVKLIVAACIAAAVAQPTCPNVTVVYQPAWSTINASLPDSTGNKYGIEDGTVVFAAGAFQLFTSEMVGDPKWVTMKLGAWTSSDGYSWTRTGTVRTSSSNYNASDPKAALWGSNYVWDAVAQRWSIVYVGYRCAPSNASGWLGNFDGEDYIAYSDVPGDAGITGPFSGDQLIFYPDPSVQYAPWQGLQGTDSFFPYQLPNGSWAAFYGTAHTEANNQYPEEWVVGLAVSTGGSGGNATGPWVRYPVGAPAVVELGTRGHSENPIVMRLPGTSVAYGVVIDYIANEGTGFGFACSNDGVSWAAASLIPTPGGARTPLGLLPMNASQLAAHKEVLLAAGGVRSEADYEQLLSFATTQHPSFAHRPLTEAEQQEVSHSGSSSGSSGGSGLYWLFYTQQQADWEVLRTAVVRLDW